MVFYITTMYRGDNIMELIYGGVSVAALIMLVGWTIYAAQEGKKILAYILLVIVLYLGSWVSIMSTYGYIFMKQVRMENVHRD